MRPTFRAGRNTAAILAPPLTILPLATYGAYIFLHQQDASEHVAGESLDVRPLREWPTLAAALLVIAVGVEGIVRAALSLGATFGTPSFLWGLTVIATGTSLPDAFVSVRAARNDDSVTSFTNVLGSNTFNLLVAIPVGVLLAGSATIPTMGFLAFATLVFIVFTRTRRTHRPRSLRLPRAVRGVPRVDDPRIGRRHRDGPWYLTYLPLIGRRDR